MCTRYSYCPTANTRFLKKNQLTRYVHMNCPERIKDINSLNCAANEFRAGQKLDIALKQGDLCTYVYSLLIKTNNLYDRLSSKNNWDIVLLQKHACTRLIIFRKEYDSVSCHHKNKPSYTNQFIPTSSNECQKDVEVKINPHQRLWKHIKYMTDKTYLQVLTMKCHTTISNISC